MRAAAIGADGFVPSALMSFSRTNSARYFASASSVGQASPLVNRRKSSSSIGSQGVFGLPRSRPVEATFFIFTPKFRVATSGRTLSAHQIATPVLSTFFRGDADSLLVVPFIQVSPELADRAW